MVELLHRIKIFIYRLQDREPDYLLLKPDQGIEGLWGPVQGSLDFGEKLEQAIRRKVLDDIGLNPPGQLVDLESEIEQIRNTAQERAEREATQILSDAQATAERIQRDAAAAIDSELRRAQDRLRAETSELAVELAASILAENVTDEDRGRLCRRQ